MARLSLALQNEGSSPEQRADLAQHHRVALEEQGRLLARREGRDAELEELQRAELALLRRLADAKAAISRLIRRPNGTIF